LVFLLNEAGKRTCWGAFSSAIRGSCWLRWTRWKVTAFLRSMNFFFFGCNSKIHHMLGFLTLNWFDMLQSAILNFINICLSIRTLFNRLPLSVKEITNYSLKRRCSNEYKHYNRHQPHTTHTTLAHVPRFTVHRLGTAYNPHYTRARATGQGSQTWYHRWPWYHGSPAPNPDSTYYTRLHLDHRLIHITNKRYRGSECRLEAQ
jgi:hypothetical protein